MFSRISLLVFSPQIVPQSRRAEKEKKEKEEETISKKCYKMNTWSQHRLHEKNKTSHSAAVEPEAVALKLGNEKKRVWMLGSLHTEHSAAQLSPHLLRGQPVRLV